jgi:hypothetical protein
MGNVEFQKIIKDLFPAEEMRVSPDKVVAGCKARKIPLEKRTLQDFSTKGMLPKPIRIGRNAFYGLDIFDKIAALFILKDIFHLSHNQIADMLKGGASSVTEIVEAFHKVLSCYFNWEEKGNDRSLIFEVVNTKRSDAIIEKLVKEISEGLVLSSIDAQDYVKEFKKVIVKRKE